MNEIKIDNDEKVLDELTNSSAREKKKILKISFLKFIIIALIIGFTLVIGITFFINSTTIKVPTTDNSWLFDYQGHWECVGCEENRYLNDVYGAWIYRYDLLLYDYNGFSLVKQSRFHKQYNNGKYDPTALSSKDEVARGIIINEGENVYLYFTEIDFETLDLSAHGFQDVTAINDYGFRPGDKTRVLVTSDNYNIMTVYIPDGEIIFKK